MKIVFNEFEMLTKSIKSCQNCIFSSSIKTEGENDASDFLLGLTFCTHYCVVTLSALVLPLITASRDNPSCAKRKEWFSVVLRQWWTTVSGKVKRSEAK